jgi:hypothetical protein
MSQVETSAPKPTFPCPACGLEYSRAEYLRRHERKVRPLVHVAFLTSSTNANPYPITNSIQKHALSNATNVPKTLHEGLCIPAKIRDRLPNMTHVTLTVMSCCATDGDAILKKWQRLNQSEIRLLLRLQKTRVYPLTVLQRPA